MTMDNQKIWAGGDFVTIVDRKREMPSNWKRVKNRT